MKMVMGNLYLYITYEQERQKLWINTASGSGAEYTVTNPKQLAFAMQEYVENYCMEECKDEN